MIVMMSGCDRISRVKVIVCKSLPPSHRQKLKINLVVGKRDLRVFGGVGWSGVVVVVVPLSDLRLGFRNRLDSDGRRVIHRSGPIHRLPLLKVQVGVDQLVLLPPRPSLREQRHAHDYVVCTVLHSCREEGIAHLMLWVAGPALVAGELG